MKLIVCHLTRPSSRLRGYLRCTLIEPAPNTFVGTASRRTADSIAEAVKQDGCHGFVAVSDASAEQKMRFAYFSVEGKRLMNLDGLTLIVRSVKVPDALK